MIAELTSVDVDVAGMSQPKYVIKKMGAYVSAVTYLQGARYK